MVLAERKYGGKRNYLLIPLSGKKREKSPRTLPSKPPEDVYSQKTQRFLWIVILDIDLTNDDSVPGSEESVPASQENVPETVSPVLSDADTVLYTDPNDDQTILSYTLDENPDLMLPSEMAKIPVHTPVCDDHDGFLPDLAEVDQTTPVHTKTHHQQ